MNALTKAALAAGVGFVGWKLVVEPWIERDTKKIVESGIAPYVPSGRPTGYPPPPGVRTPPGFHVPAPPAEASVSVELWFVSVLYELQPDESWKIVGQEPWQSYLATDLRTAADALAHEQWAFLNQAFGVELYRPPPPWKVALLWGMGRHLRDVLTGMPASPSALGVVASKGNARA